MEIKKLLPAFFLLFISLECFGIKAYKGELDLSAHHWQIRDHVPLDGEWEVYWDKVLYPDNFHSDSLLHFEYLQYRTSWNDLTRFKNKPHAQGAATYRLKLIMPDDMPALYLAMPALNSAYAIYINGKGFYGNGEVSEQASGYKPYWKPTIKPILLQPGENEILLQVANFDHHTGGAFPVFTLGTDKTIVFARNFSFSSVLFLAGKIIICSLLALGLFVYNRKDKSFLFLGSSLLLLGIHLLSSHDYLINSLFTWISWSALIRIEHISLTASLLLYLFFIRNFIKQAPRYRLLFKGLVALGSFLILSSVLSNGYYTMFTPYYVLILLLGTGVLGLIHLRMINWGKRMSWVTLFGTVALFLFLLFKSLAGLGFMAYPQIVLFVLLSVFIICHVAMILIRFGESIKEMHARGEVAETAQKDFLNVISHELRTPLNAIMGMGDMLSKTELTASQRDKLETIRKSGDELNSLLMDVLSMSEINRNTMKLDKRPMIVTDVIDEAIKLAKKDLANKPVQFGKIIDENIPATLVGDAIKLKQVIRHLLSNAFKFTKEGEVQLKAEVMDAGKKGNVIQFTITDTGEGMSRSQLREVFTPFTQGQKGNTRVFGGTGLGLAVSKEMIELMEGHLQITSKKGEGTIAIFDVKLGTPRLNIITEDTHLRKDNLDTSLRILYAEDNPVNQKLLSMMLKSMGIEIDIANNGKEAWEKALVRPYNIILMDVQMPVMDGIEATRRIIEDVRNRPIIVAVTANAGAADKMKCVEAGMNDFMAKPIKADELKHILIKWQGLREYLDDQSGSAGNFLAG